MTAANADDQKVRLDKWLWAARFYKTRSLAKEAIEGGKVHYNSQRTKPGKIVETGAKVTLRLGWQEKIVIVDDISDRRRGAPEAQKLYHETDDSVNGGKIWPGNARPCRLHSCPRLEGRARKIAGISSASGNRMVCNH